MRTARPYMRRSDDHAHPLVRQVFRLCDDQRASVRDVQQRAGLAHNTMRRWRSHHSPTVINLEAILAVLGYKLAIVPEDCHRPQDFARYQIRDDHPRVTHDTQSPAANGVAYDAASHEGA